MIRERSVRTAPAFQRPAPPIEAPRQRPGQHGAHGGTATEHAFARLPVVAGAMPLRLETEIPAQLPAATPAWSAGGMVHLAPEALFAEPSQRQDMLRHERIHALEQQHGERDDSPAARQAAENRAGGIADPGLGQGVPALLAYPPQSFKPWQKVWIGHPGIVGEVEAAGVKVRLFMDYGELANVRGYGDYFCGPHDPAPILERAAAMQAVATQVSKVNAAITGRGRHRVDLVIIAGDASNDGYRYFDNKGLVVLSRDEFIAGNWQGTINHEASHGIFEFHAEAGKAPANSTAPDSFALAVADLFNRLQNTREVPVPGKSFATEKPPLVLPEGERGKAAGLLMVHDTLWSGSGGHPQDNVSEFFASANAAFLTEPKLLRQIIAYYAKADPAIAALGKELLDLLAASANKTTAKTPSPRDRKAAADTVTAAGATPVFDASHMVFSRLLDPASMPAPDTIYCQPAGNTPKPSVDELLDFDTAPKPSEPAKKPPKPAPATSQPGPSSKERKP